MEYTTVASNDLANLIEQVNQHLNEGWKLYGNLCVTTVYNQATRTNQLHHTFFQPMTRQPKTAAKRSSRKIKPSTDEEPADAPPDSLNY